MTAPYPRRTPSRAPSASGSTGTIIRSRSSPRHAPPGHPDRQPGQRPGAAERRLVRGLGRTALHDRIQPVRPDALRGPHRLARQSYRAYTFPWTGAPASPPSLAVKPASAGAATVYASWNGATQVSSWRVLAGQNPAQLTIVASAASDGFQTAIPVESAAPDFAVQALSATGQVLGTSHTVAR